MQRDGEGQERCKSACTMNIHHTLNIHMRDTPHTEHTHAGYTSGMAMSVLVACYPKLL